MTTDQPDPAPQVSEPAGRGGPAYATEPTSDAAPGQTPAVDAEPATLNGLETRALRLLRRLGADPDEAAAVEDGRWPTTWQSLLWDLAPDKVAPRREGVVLPAWTEPRWLADLPKDRVEPARELVRAERDRLLESIAKVELKAARLLTPFVALLTGTIALSIFQAAAIGFSVRGILAGLGTFSGSIGVGFLLLGMLRALDADTRLGTSVRASLEQEVASDYPRVALRSDHRGVEAARFVLRKKGARILFARAAISRGLFVLVIAAIFGAVVLGLAPSNDHMRRPSRTGDPAAPSESPSRAPSSTQPGEPPPPVPTPSGSTDGTPTGATSEPSPPPVPSSGSATTAPSPAPTPTRLEGTPSPPSR